MIGIDSRFLFGFLAAVLAVIPYVGTIAGAAIPILYVYSIKCGRKGAIEFSYHKKFKK